MASWWVPTHTRKLPFKEYNADRSPRPIIWKARRLNASWAYVASIFSSAPLAANMHWGLEVGRYMHQIHTDEGKKKYLQLERLRDGQIWDPDVPERVVGWCSLTDKEVDEFGMSPSPPLS